MGFVQMEHEFTSDAEFQALLSQKDSLGRLRGVCETCGRCVRAKSNHWGKTYWRKKCYTCSITPEKKREKERLVDLRQRAKFAATKLKPCSMCAFIPVEACQMDWDHIDGNHQNNDPSNLQLLCANCHRLKTKLSRDTSRWRKSLTACSI